MTQLQLTDIKKSFHKQTVIHGVNLTINSGEFVVFVGPSGCGKSTLLRMIAGLEEISDGTLQIGSDIVNDVVPAERGVAMVFQSYALYPHMTVFENMAFGLKQARTPKAEIDRLVRAAADTLQITDYLDRLPKHLSGGQRQRVAIGRAIVRDPKVFLFDEPLSNLDAALRVQTRIEIANLHKRLAATMIYVTHDQVEAMTLADRIVVLNKGQIEQVGSPLELYNQPANQFVAEFIGSPKMNILQVDKKDNQLCLRSGETLFDNWSGPANVGAVGIRPEHLVPVTKAEAQFSGPIRHIEHLGEYCLAYVQLTDHQDLTVKLSEEQAEQHSTDLHLSPLSDKLYMFDKAGMALSAS
ncbi:ATPase component of ABC-type sugar transporter [SAR116 cluster alpha proteobacterium HIMB100]|nr:ATPase component of ABC-type sugar transporter [SAR116 cluster alpha proteobacterium HIMB100]